MTFNTGNTVGSTDPRDLSDNAENFDRLSVGTELAYPDRLGVQRKSWAGLEQQFSDFMVSQGWETVYLQYAAGVVVHRPTQLIERQGELYRVRLQSSLPLTLGGTWETDAPNLVAVGNQSLRDMLAASGGAGMVGHGTGTVATSLAALEESVAQIGTEVGTQSLTQFGINDKSLNSVNGWAAAQNPWNARVVNILGDSISYGANAENIRRDSYVGILRKMLNQEFGSHNYGFVPIYDKTSNEFGVFKEIHTQTGQTGTITSVSGAAAGHLPNGYGLTGTPGSTISYSMPAEYRYIAFWYDGTATGVIDVVIDGVVRQTITADGTGTGYMRRAQIDLANYMTTGVVNFTLNFVSGAGVVTGFDLTHQTTAEFRLQNFSRDGRKGMHVSQSVINAACAGSYFTVWALGANDRAATGADLDAYKLRIDWLIEAAATYGTRVVILDTLFQAPDSNPIRQELLRAAQSIPGSVYVNTANIMTTDGHVLSAADLSALRIGEGSHPEETGHRLIAETLAKRLGLFYTSKRKAALDDITFRAIPLQNGLLNALSYQGGFTGYRINNGSISLIVRLSTVPANNTVIGQMDLTGPAPRFMAQTFRTEQDSAGNWGLITVATNGTLTYTQDPKITVQPTRVLLSVNIPTSEDGAWY